MFSIFSLRCPELRLAGTSCKMSLHPTDRLLREIREIILQNIMENAKSLHTLLLAS